MRLTGMIILLAVALTAGTAVLAADPEIQNVVLAQRTDGSGLVDITYALVDPRLQTERS